MLYLCISFDQTKFDCHLLSHKQDTELAIICKYVNVNKALAIKPINLLKSIIDT